jgi:hypothetical protein
VRVNLPSVADAGDRAARAGRMDAALAAAGTAAGHP